MDVLSVVLRSNYVRKDVCAIAVVRTTAVFFLRARVIMPGCTVAHSARAGIGANVGEVMAAGKTPRLSVFDQRAH